MTIRSEPKNDTNRIYSFEDIQQLEKWAFDRGVTEGRRRAKAERLERIKALQDEHRVKAQALGMLISLES